MMNQKRVLSNLPVLCAPRKRICASPHESAAFSDVPDSELNDAAVSDTQAALLLIRKQFPSQKLESHVPPIILQHQLYNIVKNRTKADQEVEELREQGLIRLFKLGCETGDVAIVFTEDYNVHLKEKAQGMKYQDTVQKVLSDLLPVCNDLNVNKEQMLGKYAFKDSDVSLLVQAGVLTVRDVGSWWIAIPGAGFYVRSFIKARKAVLKMIRRCKYREILLAEIQARKLGKAEVFGIPYLLHDIIGAQFVACTPTTSGMLLRLNDAGLKQMLI